MSKCFCILTQSLLVLPYAVDDYAVGIVDDGGVEGGEVYLCSGFGVVSHSFADDGEWDALFPGYARPRVACDVHCYVCVDSYGSG